MDDPLAGLDDVPWERLHHAYGPATDTPGLLRQIARGETDDETWAQLCTSIVHQDTVYEASAAAAPFLINLTRVTRGDDLVGVLLGTPAVWRTMLLDALLRAFPDASARPAAFGRGRTLLWLAFHHRLHGPAQPPRPYVVAAPEFPFPRDRGGGSPQTMERSPSETLTS